MKICGEQVINFREKKQQKTIKKKFFQKIYIIKKIKFFIKLSASKKKVKIITNKHKIDKLCYKIFIKKITN